MDCSFCETFKNFAVIVFLVQIIFGIKYIYQQFLRPALYGDKLNFKKYGQWASKLNFKIIILDFVFKFKFIYVVVTGATDGIGKSYARTVRIFFF